MTTRSLAHRARRFLLDLRPPKRTLLRWAHRSGTGSVVFGASGRSLDEQDPGRVVLGAGAVVHDDVHFHLGPAGHVELGAGAILAPHVIIAADRSVRIGSHCHIGRYAAIVDTWTYGRAGGPDPEPVVIGDGAWIGSNAVIGPGVEVAPGATVPAGTALHGGER